MPFGIGTKGARAARSRAKRTAGENPQKQGDREMKLGLRLVCTALRREGSVACPYEGLGVPAQTRTNLLCVDWMFVSKF